MKLAVADYDAFVSRKLSSIQASGFTPGALPNGLFGHQSALVNWSLKRGRSAIFADTGLGKSAMEMAWGDAVAKHTNMPVLALTPLAVAPQLVDEGRKFGVSSCVVRSGADIDASIPAVYVTNYDRLHLFNPAVFGGVILDESSVIKHHDAKTFRLLTDAFKDTPYKLPASATPAPNDWTELGTHAEFLGVCSRAEMLAEFFTHDGGDTSVWRLKGHARHQFWKWVVSWGALIRRPSDLGFDDAKYILPKLHIHEHSIEVDVPTNGMLFAMEAQTLSERRDARRASMADRVKECAALVNSEPNEPWVVWCDLNDESAALTEAINGAVEVKGADAVEVKEQRLRDFASGKSRCLVSKPSICGWGLNWQHAARMAFVGVTDSYESYYQAVRRCWRFGQKREVHVHLFVSNLEGAVSANLKRKEREAGAMAEALSAETRDSVMQEVRGMVRETNAHDATRQVVVPSFLKEAA